jgi:hypothetical protein
MQSIPTGDPDFISFKECELLKMMENTFLWENPHTGHLTGINYQI